MSERVAEVLADGPERHDHEGKWSEVGRRWLNPAPHLPHEAPRAIQRLCIMPSQEHLGSRQKGGSTPLSRTSRFGLRREGGLRKKRPSSRGVRPNPPSQQLLSAEPEQARRKPPSGREYRPDSVGLAAPSVNARAGGLHTVDLAASGAAVEQCPPSPGRLGDALDIAALTLPGSPRQGLRGVPRRSRPAQEHRGEPRPRLGAAVHRHDVERDVPGDLGAAVQRFARPHVHPPALG